MPPVYLATMLRHALVLLIASIPSTAWAQGSCPSQELTRRLLERGGFARVIDHPVDPSVRSGGDPTIPVVVHVVWNTPAENVPDAAILAVIDRLNTDFSAQNADLVFVRAMFQPAVADAGIAFCLAHTDPQGNATAGITRTETGQAWFDPQNETDAMKSPPDGIDAWDPTSYLNVWICDISSGGGNTAGYAYLPGGGIAGSSVDGLVLDVDLGLGTGNRTATHEVGHYLGVPHPWGANGNCVDDDGFGDTPLTSGPTLSCFDTTLQTCGVPVQYENFMDYSACRVMFTGEQAACMNAILDTLRAGLADGIACGNVAVNQAGDPAIQIVPARDAWIISPSAGTPWQAAVFDPRGRELLRTAMLTGPSPVPRPIGAPGIHLIRVVQGTTVHTFKALDP